VPLRFPEPVVADGALHTSVLFIDAFGNCRLAGQPADLASLSDRQRQRLEAGERFTVRIGESSLMIPWQRTFGAVAQGELLLYEDADYAGLAIGVNQGSAADRLTLAYDAPIVIEPA
jgi:S-adenosylmethionine hydrolase